MKAFIDIFKSFCFWTYHETIQLTTRMTFSFIKVWIFQVVGNALFNTFEETCNFKEIDFTRLYFTVFLDNGKEMSFFFNFPENEKKNVFVLFSGKRFKAPFRLNVSL